MAFCLVFPAIFNDSVDAPQRWAVFFLVGSWRGLECGVSWAWLLIVRILGMLPRMGVPLLGGVILQISVKPLAKRASCYGIYRFVVDRVYLSVVSMRPAMRDSDRGQASRPSMLIWAR